MVLQMDINNLMNRFSWFKELCTLDNRNPTKEEIEYMNSIDNKIKEYNNILEVRQKALDKKGGRTLRQKRRKTKRSKL
jgi:hypothetical protein